MNKCNVFRLSVTTIHLLMQFVVVAINLDKMHLAQVGKNNQFLKIKTTVKVSLVCRRRRRKKTYFTVNFVLFVFFRRNCRKEVLDLDQSYFCSAFLGFDFLLLYDFVHRQQSECPPVSMERQARKF